MAMQTNVSQLSPSKSAPVASGNLYEPSPTEDAAVSGGWGGARRLRIRKTVFGSVLLAGGLLTVARLSRAREAAS